MTPTETAVALAAVSAGRAARYEEIYAIASAETKVPIDDVKRIVENLAAEGILNKHGGPAQNLAEGGRAGDVLARGWYDKGDCWPGDLSR